MGDEDGRFVPFRRDCRQRLAGGRWLVTMKGEHDLSNADELGDRLAAIFATGTSLVVDLRETQFIDSSILLVLLEAVAQ
jgi:anti-anti-sigma factor